MSKSSQGRRWYWDTICQIWVSLNSYQRRTTWGFSRARLFRDKWSGTVRWVIISIPRFRAHGGIRWYMEILSSDIRALIRKGSTSCGRWVGKKEAEITWISCEVAGGQLGKLPVRELRWHANQNTRIGLSQLVHQQDVNLGRGKKTVNNVTLKTVL